MCTQKMRALSSIGAEKITFPPKPDGQTNIRTDISIYKVASLLKTCWYTNSLLKKEIVEAYLESSQTEDKPKSYAKNKEGKTQH